MMKKLLCSLSLLSIIGLGANAQTIAPCGTDEAYHKLLATHPEIAERDAALSKEIAEKLSKLSSKELLPFAKTTADGTTIYDVPVVFHVIHDYGSEYVKDSDIELCVSRVNSYYAKQNADTIDVISPYKGFIHNSNTRYIGKANIRWHLATKDPFGNPTNGITRRRSHITKSAGDLAKYDQWPPNNYMNIWVINTMSASHAGAAAYAYKPASGDAIPYYDGVITLWDYLSSFNGVAIAHELGHELNLDHPWGSTNSPEVLCNDDEVDDTPPTKGHKTCLTAALYDTACLYKRNNLAAKPRLDSIKIISDTATNKGIVFKNRTASTIESVSFFPSAAIGSTYIIGLKRNNILIDTAIVVSTVKDTVQVVTRKFKIPPADTATNFTLCFIQNPGAARDTLTSSTSVYPRGFNGSILIKEVGSSDNFYNFFYDWKYTYGYYKIYANDSLVDYPDTTNTQNIMDYSYCSKMFTAGQVERMRAALTSTIAKRNSLITPENLAKTGALDPAPALKPKAEFSVEKGATTAGIQVTGAEPSYFLCADNADASFNFRFKDRSWQANVTSTNWNFSNSPTNATPSAGLITTKFATPGWVTVKLTAGNTNGSDEFETTPGVYVADPKAINPLGYYQDFTNDAENAKWPIFNYYNNRYKWEIYKGGSGVYDGMSMRYRTYDDRGFPENLLGDAAGDYDDFFSPAFDLSVLGAVNGNLNFMYAGAYATNNPDLMKDVFEIAYSTTCGGNWTTLKTMKDAELQTVGTIPVGEYRADWNEWKPMSIDLKTSTGTPIRDKRVFFRFRYKPSSRPVTFSSSAMYASGNNFYLDRINISDNPLSVNEMILGDKKVALAPNPATNNTYVLFQKSNANVKVEVLDMTGKLVYSVKANINQSNARVEIPVAQLGAKGIYLVRITGDDNLNQTEKLVVY
jgi:hypothetical protein